MNRLPRLRLIRFYCLIFIVRSKEGDTVTPGTKVSVVSKSSPSGTHVVPLDDKVVKDARPRSPPAGAPQPTPATEKIDK
uniref:Uncharacterized protein n=1 Tax=Musa acuminata subsp. malaccensis TaxID=214687 RepID=A0A804JHI6_MUSAM